MTGNSNENNEKNSDNKDIRDSILLYSAGVLPSIVPGLQLVTSKKKEDNKPTSSPMDTLKTCFEDWRAIKEEHPHSEKTIPMDVFEGSLYQVLDTLDQDIFQPTDGVSNPSTSTLTSSPPASLSDRISILLERIKIFSTVFREQIAYWKNAVSVWLFDSLLSPTWQEFLIRIEEALSTSVSCFQSNILGIRNNELTTVVQPLSTQTEDNPVPHCLSQVPSDDISEAPPKSRFEYVVPPASKVPQAPSAVACDSNSTTLPEIPSITSLFKDFAQPLAVTSNLSINSLKTSDRSITTEFFDKDNGTTEETSVPTPFKSPGYTAPNVRETTDADWYIKWTKNNKSTTSITSTRSSGVEAIEAISDFLKADYSSNNRKIAEVESNVNTIDTHHKDVAASLGFENIE